MTHPKNKIANMQCKRVAQQVENADVFSFFNLLTSPEILETVETLLPEHRERLFPPTLTLSMFMSQILHADSSCQRVVNEFAIKRHLGGLSSCSVSTGGFCKARQRLPSDLVTTLTQTIGAMVSKNASPNWDWYGRRVKLVDGTTVTMPDTELNQSRFPQQTGQQPGLGFPIARIVAVLCYSTGVVLDSAIGAYKGKGTGEHALFRQLMGGFEPGDLIVGDRYYPSYFVIATLIKAGAEAVFQQHGVRKTDFRQGQRLGSKDHLVQWDKPKQKPDWMPQPDFDNFPDQITVREFQYQGKVIITTLPHQSDMPKKAIGDLYKQRWHVELDLRNLKTTLGMETLSCKTPDMNEKEMWVYFLAYNLIRLLMSQAAVKANINPRKLSFKHTLQVWIIWSQQQFTTDTEEDLTRLFCLIVSVRVGKRPGRIEPRCVKKRPKPFPLLTNPRDVMREEIRKNGHPKKLK